MTTHIGSYGKLAAAHEAINSWRGDQPRIRRMSREIYGVEPERRERVVYQTWCGERLN